MRPEEYRSIIKRLETHYQEFMHTSQGSEMFGEEEKKTIQGHFDKAQTYYDTLIIQLPAYSECKMSSPYPEIVSLLNCKSTAIFFHKKLIFSKFTPNR